MMELIHNEYNPWSILKEIESLTDGYMTTKSKLQIYLCIQALFNM